eukprot:gene1281-2469_t
MQSHKWIKYLLLSVIFVHATGRILGYIGNAEHNKHLPLSLKSTISSVSRKNANSFFQDSVIRHLFPITPILIFIMGASQAEASALNPHAIIINGPFFQGWLVRLVDHQQNMSFIFIVGSFSSRKSKNYNEHYIFCGIDIGGERIFAEAFPSCEEVQITGSTPSSPSWLSSNTFPLNITWSANNYGKFVFQGNTCSASFKFKELELKFKTQGRKSWSTTNELDGPEGWLGYTTLLPCHYCVHSTGSPCSYDVLLQHNRKQIKGNGYTHIEGNHGTFFPSGWVWAQGIASDNSASLSVVGGRFTIGVVNPMNWVIYLRFKNRTMIFRTTDMAKVSYRIDAIGGALHLECVTALGSNKLILTIRSSTDINGFSPPLYTPSPDGFSNIPGCRETYTAIAEAVCYDWDIETNEFSFIEKIHFPLTALEFGGTFLGQFLQKN